MRPPSLFALLVLLPAALAAQQEAAPSYTRGNNLPPRPRMETIPARFWFATEASAGLRDLWRLSLEEQRERVACLAGTVVDDSVRITRVLLLEPAGADSMSISAQDSIDRCGPPDYQGTVHTHIAHTDEGLPYDRFSGSDRGVMYFWWQKWRIDGLFCVLYSDTQAYCEVNGARPALPSRSAY